ncbi:hypothetical protein D9C73_012322 [Collichthys lucidus]|uniref:Uncharacterized protein n=1 Tax=Collichthys lucidus TaxID=240159 RepID=A0A4U5UVV2_COLLU|nr:hypothetical protein D9C73_012322 [Collichthys lucidus]
MPRSAAKSRADKTRRRSLVPVAAPPTQELEEEYIIPGRFTKTQWMDMLIQEEADEAVGEIMDELMSRVMEGCLKVHIERQLPAYTASWAKSYLTQILEQRVMCLDEGDRPEEGSRTEDSEPTPSPSHAWAPGCVPVVNPTPPPHPISKEVEGKPSTKKPSELPKVGPRYSKQQTEQTLTSLKPVASSKDQPEDFRRRSEADLRLKKLSPSIHQKYQTIPKLDPSCLPRHCIPIQYEILDNDTKPRHKKPSGLSKLEPSYSKQQTEKKPVTSSKDSLEDFRKRTEADLGLNKMSPFRHPKEEMMYSGPLRLDTMKLAKGVSPINHKPINPPSQSNNLKPIRSEPSVPRYSVEELTSGPSPRVRPSYQSESINI